MRAWTLGDLIAALRNVEPDKQVRFDFCYLVPTPVDSWRGIYAELAIGFTTDHYAKGSLFTVGELLANLQSAVGATFTGYKGGQYIMWEGTPLHVDNHGNSSDTVVVGLDAVGFYAVILTEEHVP